MSYVVVNAITVPDGAGPELERRFASRAGDVEGRPGFVGFRMWRPADGRDTWYVVTEWESRDAFEAWTQSPEFAHSHRRAGSAGPVSTEAELMQFEVVDFGS
jgi:heme-degrading monooxygenase HmoA